MKMLGTRFVLCAGLLGIFWQCSKKSAPTNPPTAALSGTIKISASTDASGITIELYELVPRDSLWDKSQTDYPYIGFGQSQTWLFDHREQQPVATTLTDNSGAFMLQGYAEGVYHLVARKAGFGWKYVLELSLSDQPLSLETLYASGITLYPEQSLASPLAGRVELEPDRHYLVAEHLEIPESAALVVPAGTTLRVQARKRINVFGELTLAGQPAAPVFVTIDEQELSGAKMQGINLLRSSSGRLENVSVSDAVVGIELKTEAITPENLFLTRSDRGMILSNVDGVYRKLVFYRNVIGLRLESEANCTVEHCLFLRASGRGMDTVTNEALVQNNFFANCQSGIDFGGQARTKVQNNYFLADSIALNILRLESVPVITGNTIETCSIAMQILFPLSTPLKPVTNCNFIDIKEWYFYTQGMRLDIQSDNNFWDASSESTINAKIWDGNDYDLPGFTAGKVIFEPRASEEIMDAYPKI